MHPLIRYLLFPASIGCAIGLAVLLFANRGADPQPGFADAVKRASPAVVNIYSQRRLMAPRICQSPRFRIWCERYSGNNASRMQRSLGSGVIVHTDGYILTNNHIIEDADEILVAFADGQTTNAILVGSDPETDLAVIRVPGKNLTPITISDSDDVNVGDIALAIGNPFGLESTVSMGIISAKGRPDISRSPYDDFIQTDAAINPGNSGGALIDASGALIGLNTLIVSQSGGSDGIGFAIPAKLAMGVLQEIVAKGHVTRGWLGVELANSPPPGSGVGLEVTGVFQNGPAQLAGLLGGDQILAVNEQPAVSSAAVSRFIADTRPGDPIVLDIMRGSQQLTITAKAGERRTPN